METTKTEQAQRLSFCEAAPTRALLDRLTELSARWETEHSCRGYCKNTDADILENRIFLAREGEVVVGYALGHVSTAENASSVMPNGTPCFELEELYVLPENRGRGIGRKLMAYVEQAVQDEAAFLTLTTATKDFDAILRFYTNAVGMDFWSARLFKKIGGDEA